MFVIEVSSGYRSARRAMSFLCALGLAWSAAQFEVKELPAGALGAIDISGAEIPVLLFCAVAYAAVRTILEYAMQSIEVRRWRCAQTDFNLCMLLVHATVLILIFALGVGGRSFWQPILIIMLSTSGMGLMAAFLAKRYVGQFFWWIIKRSAGVAPRAADWMAWACAVAILTVFLFSTFAFSYFLHPEKINRIIPLPRLMYFFWGAVMLSGSLHYKWSRIVFAEPPWYETGILAGPRPFWSWYADRDDGSHPPGIQLPARTEPAPAPEDIQRPE